MVNKEILNQEFLKSIESEYIFDNAPINRFIKNKENLIVSIKEFNTSDVILTLKNNMFLSNLEKTSKSFFIL